MATTSVNALSPRFDIYETKAVPAAKQDPLDILFSEWDTTPPASVVETNVKNLASAQLIICLMDDEAEEKYLKFYGDVFQRLDKEKGLRTYGASEGIFILEDYADKGTSCIDRAPLKYFPPLGFSSVGWLSSEVSQLIRFTIDLIRITLEALALLRVIDFSPKKKSFESEIQFVHASCHLASLPPGQQKTVCFVQEAFAKPQRTSLGEIVVEHRVRTAPLKAYKKMRHLKPYMLKNYAALLKQSGQNWIESNKAALLKTVFPINQQSLIDTIQKHKNKKIIIGFIGFQHGNPRYTAYPEEVKKLLASIKDIPYAIIALPQ